MSTLLKGDGLALVRGGRLLFEGLDIELKAGEALQVVGPNGCGKSSLIRLVAGLLKPNAGRIERAEAAPYSRAAASRQRTQGISTPMNRARPSGVSTHGLFCQGGSCRMCWPCPHASSATQWPSSS